MTSFDGFLSMWLNIAKGDPKVAYAKLTRAYSESHRAYHTIEHVAFCLKEIQELRYRWAGDAGDRIVRERAIDLCPNPHLVLAAIWYHDAVYDPRSDSNEEDSATFAESSLNLPQAPAAALRELILDTKHTSPPNTVNGQFVADTDLASLGTKPKDFDRAGQAIRREYSWVEEKAYKEKRATILAKFLKRSRIYYTPMFFDAYEKQARQNLKRAISELRKQP